MMKTNAIDRIRAAKGFVSFCISFDFDELIGKGSDFSKNLKPSPLFMLCNGRCKNVGT